MVYINKKYYFFSFIKDFSEGNSDIVFVCRGKKIRRKVISHNFNTDKNNNLNNKVYMFILKPIFDNNINLDFLYWGLVYPLYGGDVRIENISIHNLSFNI